MSKKGQFIKYEWAKHLRSWRKRQFWHKERKAEKIDTNQRASDMREG